MTSRRSVADDRFDSRGQRIALVTGGSRGIGAAIVRVLASRGVNVVFTYRQAREAADAVIDSCGDEGARIRAVAYDLLRSDPADLVAKAVDEFGGLDAAILNAGQWSGGLLERRSDAEWWETVEHNLRGAARLAAASIPRLRESASGSIVFVSSAVALIGFPGDTAYGAAKSGLFGLARSLAKELGGDGVRVNALAPGFVETDMTRSISGTARDMITSRALLRRFGNPEEIARAAVFLCEDATYCTGTTLTVDGGWSL
jgi:3-oxoacyl-[acyl-carrier protein] reductase